ncbi:MAG: FAD-dependent oxidoreductase [Bacteroidetes bacterium RBG_13_43_22]|nr:MAG: FAD-dependent oxidoreductase [Bacteroidetes bacterium RBG_13_43_22]
MNRNDLITDLQYNKDRIWDIIVIGGGATGLGVALDAVTRGYKTLLLEQSDFAKSTSSRSTKLVHGGVRYLAQGDILLVKEALHERGIMLKNAPHLTQNQEFVIPVYTVWDVILYTVGLKFYDLLSGKLSLGKSYFISRSETLNRLPLLQPGKLKGGIVYHDGQFDDSRMAVALARACMENGGSVLNYFRMNGFIKDEKGKITGVYAENLETGSKYNISAKLVISATGVFADEIHRMDDQQAKQTIRPSQGVHIVLDNSFLQSRSAIMIPKTDDGRVLFAIPWYGKVVVGSTDTPLDTITLEPKALDEEITFILRTAGKYLVKPPAREDVLCIFAGLRPLAANPDNPSATKEVSRRHKITMSSSGLLSIIGGKWTSYRRMAEETIDRAIREGILEKRKCMTKKISFFSPDPELHEKRLQIYGNKAVEIEKMICEQSSLGKLLNPLLPYTKAEIVWICRNEMPRTLEDMLARRTRSLFLDVRTSITIAPAVADIMAGELRYDNQWKEQQLEEYNKLALNYL